MVNKVQCDNDDDNDDAVLGAWDKDCTPSRRRRTDKNGDRQTVYKVQLTRAALNSWTLLDLTMIRL